MKIQLQTNGFELNGELEKYAAGKLRVLRRRIPRRYRAAAECTMEFSQAAPGGRLRRAIAKRAHRATGGVTKATPGATGRAKDGHAGPAPVSTCRITLRLGSDELQAEETTLHLYAALDIAAVRIGYQLRDYAAQHQRRGLRALLPRHWRRHNG